MRFFSSRSSLFACQTRICESPVYWFIIIFRKIYLSAHMITVLKQNRPLISLHNVCMSGAKALLRLHTQVCIGTEA